MRTGEPGVVELVQRAAAAAVALDFPLGLTGELLAQFRILGGDTDWASIQVTFAHHDATQSDQWRGSETKFLSTQQRSDHHIASRLQTTVGLQHHTAAQIIQHQRLVGFGETKPLLPNVDDASRAQNRRVEFRVVER